MNLVFAEKDAEHAPDPRGVDRVSGIRGGTADGIGNQGALFFQPLIETLFPQDFEGRDPGGHGQRVAGEGACLVDAARRGEEFHDFPLAAKGPDRQTAADDLAERGQVGSNAVQFLGAAVGHPESGHDLIENEDDPFPVAEVAQPFEETLPGRQRFPCCRQSAR